MNQWMRHGTPKGRDMSECRESVALPRWRVPLFASRVERSQYFVSSLNAFAPLATRLVSPLKAFALLATRLVSPLKAFALLATRLVSPLKAFALLATRLASPLKAFALLATRLVSPLKAFALLANRLVSPLKAFLEVLLATPLGVEVRCHGEGRVQMDVERVDQRRGGRPLGAWLDKLEWREFVEWRCSFPMNTSSVARQVGVGLDNSVRGSTSWSGARRLGAWLDKLE